MGRPLQAPAAGARIVHAVDRGRADGNASADGPPASFLEVARAQGSASLPGVPDLAFFRYALNRATHPSGWNALGPHGVQVPPSFPARPT